MLKYQIPKFKTPEFLRPLIKIIFAKGASSGSRSYVHHVLYAVGVYSWIIQCNLVPLLKEHIE
jgi:hypothetical protein